MRLDAVVPDRSRVFIIPRVRLAWIGINSAKACSETVIVVSRALGVDFLARDTSDHRIDNAGPWRNIMSERTSARFYLQIPLVRSRIDR